MPLFLSVLMMSLAALILDPFYSKAALIMVTLSFTYNLWLLSIFLYDLFSEEEQMERGLQTLGPVLTRELHT